MIQKRGPKPALFFCCRFSIASNGMVWHRATCPELARSEIVETVEGSVAGTRMVEILNPYSLTEAQRFFYHEETRLRKACIVSCEGHEEIHQAYFPLASCSVETNPFEKVVLSQTLFRKLLFIFNSLRLCAFVR